MASIYVADREHHADLLVFKTDRSSHAKNEDAIWEFVDRENHVTTKIFYVDRENHADLKIYFVDREHHAGWKAKSHKLMGQL